MAAGTVISGGFPGRVAQEVQPNPKCNGCLHFDGQGGRTGICTIGERPWNCGEGDAADIGYAPITRGAGTYLPGMSNRSTQAHEVGDQEASDLHGAGSNRAVTFQQVSLGEEHVHFVKSLVAQHTSMQKSMCRLCKSAGILGTTHSNIGPQICTCSPIEAVTVAKALVRQLSNLERSVLDLDDLTAFVYDAAKAGFNPRMMKGTFYHAHGKYEVSPAGGGSQHVDFHPKAGGPAARVGTYGSHREARRASETHARRFAAGTGTEHGGAPMPVASESSSKKTVANKLPKKNITFSGAHTGDTGAHPISVKSDDEDEIDKADERHPPDLKPGDLITHSSASGFGKQTAPGTLGHDPHGQLAQVHSVRKNPHTGDTHVQVKYHQSNGKMSGPRLLSGYDSSRHVTHEDMQHHSKTLKTHFNAKAKRLNAPAGDAEKSLDNTILCAEIHDDGFEKSLRWSHKTPGAASTSHGKYTVHANEGGGHTVTYTSKTTGKSHAKTFASHREALGAVTEHHLKNRPPPKKRGPKKPKAAGAGAAPAGGCPPCP